LQVQKAKQGYKLVKSLYGKYEEIPKEWEMMKLKDLCKVRQGLQIPISERFREPGPNRFQYITVKSIHSDNFEEYIEDPGKRVICNKDDILFTRTGNTGEIITNEKGVFHNNFFLIDYYRKKIFKDYLVTSLKQKRIQEIILSLAGSTTIPDINHGDFYRLMITVPQLEVQKKIAYILSNVSSLITSYNDVIEKTKVLKKGLMQQLLTKGIGHTKFKKIKSFFGIYEEIPEDWNYETIGSLNQHVTYGLTVRPKYIAKGIPLISAKEIGSGNIDYDMASKISKSDYENLYEKSKGQKNDVLISKTGTIGLVGRAKTEQTFAITQNVASLRPIQKLILPKFLEWSLRTNSFFRKCFRTLNATTILDLQLGELKKLKLPLPSLNEQQKIASILGEVDSRIDSVEQTKSYLQYLKKGLMQKLLTGQIRVKV